MSKFERKFYQRAWRQFPVVQALLELWALPGVSSKKNGLRVAVRKNYLSFYRKGQSVAKLHSTKQLLRLSVHAKYVDGVLKHDQAGMQEPGYVDFDESWLSEEKNAVRVHGWISSAASFAGAEKSYVDELIAANSGVIDIEMGLPAYEGEKNAPRMDLVLVEDHPTPLSLAFWEVKCADNSGARAKDEPKVVEQVRKYERWMEKPGRKEDVIAAYREAAAILLDLADAAARPLGHAQKSWRNLLDAPSAGVIGKPGVVIGGYCPSGYRETTEGNIERQAESFVNREHKHRLTDSFDLRVVYHPTPTEASNPLPSLRGTGH